MDAVKFSGGKRCCTFAEHREEASMVQKCVGTVEVDPETSEVREGLLRGFH